MQNKYTVDVLPQAAAEFDEIYLYYYMESGDRAVADKVTAEIEEAIYGLEDFPKAHPFSRDSRLAKMGYRKLIIGNYIALYKVDDKSKIVTVAHIYHGMTDCENHMFGQ